MRKVPVLKIKNTKIRSRIRKALLSLSFGLSIIFGILIFLLLYIIEDEVFINLLRAEQAQYKQTSQVQTSNWQPSNRYMNLYDKKQQLPETLQSVLTDKTGIYEFFEDDHAYFILHDKRQYNNHSNSQSYYITFDVSELLAVKKGKYNLIITIFIVTLFVMFLAILVSFRLSKSILSPLNKLTNELQKNGFAQMKEGFSKPFIGDEVGVLASQLEEAIEQANNAIKREFEFNSGVSHELRTPIQVALNSVELLEITQENLKNDKAMQRLKRSISQMEQISEAFLWLASQRSIEKISTNPFPVLEALNQQYKQLYPRHSLKINIDDNTQLNYLIPPPVFTVIIDNLLRNAFQHGADGEIIININSNFIQILNLKLEPKQTKQETNSNGYGIGLMIVKRICQRLDWQLNLIDSKDKYFETKIVFTHSYQ